MDNHYNPANNEKQNLSSAQPMFPSNPNFPPEGTPSAPPPLYTGPSQFPSPSGMVCLQYYPPPAQGMGYPQPYAPPSYYPQPGVAYPEPPLDTKHPDGPTQQQQQQQLVVTSNLPPGVTPVVADNRPPVSMVGAFVLSCVAYFFGGMVCAGMAFALAIVGRNSAASGNRRNAIQLRNVSYCLSIFGIIATCVLVAIYVGVFLSPAFNSEPWLVGLSPKFNASYYYSGR